MSLELITKLTKISTKLRSIEKNSEATKVDEIIEFLKTAYHPRFKRERRARGMTRMRRRQYYKKHKNLIKRKQKIYRRKFKNPMKRRRLRRHYKRFGSEL
jgi:predicted metal-dependent hydrolase